jgi:hypothetical protein
MKKIIMILMMLMGVLSLSAQRTYQGINGSSSSIISQFKRAGLVVDRSVKRKDCTGLYIPGKNDFYLVVWKKANGKIMSIVEIYKFECRAYGLFKTNEIEDEFKAHGMKPKRVVRGGEPYDVYKNKFKGGNYCDVTVSWPQSLNNPDPFNGYNYSVMQYFYPTR